ncbi:TPA: DNA-binding protein [Staphylococcus aureus]|nr:DNA-binding protein [Staphylococcus aureus]HDG8499567.1 DNA-binding protein [Staphylococcus aureus]HDG8586628.1 DNA-binding protein [Staphylococcus aureus]HDZ3299481.1 DNA-binding protein [Staphylococcus aureus]HDZ3315802.1 DNA-binding protein [Staphylococcus aureus]
MTLPKIGKPATRALNSQGIYTLEDVSQYTKPFLMTLHGVGPKAITILENALNQQHLHFKTEVHSSLPFLLTGDVLCHHAPKRQQMIDFIVATAALDIELLRSLVTTEFIWSVPGRFDIYGPQILIQELSNYYKEIASLNIQSIITHGHFGSMHGSQILKNGTVIHFAHFFEFENPKNDTKINKVTSYVVVA